MPITTKVTSSTHGEVYSIHHYVKKCASDLGQVGGFLCVIRFPPPMTLTANTEILLKVAFNTITPYSIQQGVSLDTFK